MLKILDVVVDAGLVGKAHFIYYNYIGLFFHLKLIVHSQNLQ
jgi:hypothetical protein